MLRRRFRAGTEYAVQSIVLMALLLGMALSVGGVECAPEAFPVCDLYNRIVASIGADSTLTIPHWFWKEENVACIYILVPAEVPIQGYDPVAKIEALRAILIPYYDLGGIGVYVSVVLEGYLPICGELPDAVDLGADPTSTVAGLFNIALAENPHFIEAFVPTERPFGVDNVVAVFTRAVIGYPEHYDPFYGGRLFYKNYVAEQLFEQVIRSEYNNELSVSFTSPVQE